MSLRLLQIVLPKRHREELERLVQHIDADKRWRTNLADDLELTTLVARADQLERLSDALDEQFGIVDRFRQVFLPVEATRPKLPEPEPQAKPDPEEPAAEDELPKPPASGSVGCTPSRTPCRLFTRPSAAGTSSAPTATPSSSRP